MFKPTKTKQLALRALAAVLGVGLLSYLIWRVGPQKLCANISTLGWGLALIIALGGVSYLVRTWAWRMTFAGCRGGISFPRMFQFRIASEAVGQVGVLGQLFGEGLRISAFDLSIPIDSRISSVILDRTLFIVAGAMVSIIGIASALLVVSLTHTMRLYSLLFAGTLIGLLVVVALAMLNRWPVLSRPARSLCRLRSIRDRVESTLPLIHAVENKLFDFHRSTPGAFWASFALNLACQGMAVSEVYLVLWLLGVKIGLLGALIFEALTKLVNAIGALNPGNIGTYEGGNMLIASLFGLSGAVGLSVAVARRLRAIFWAAVGGVFLVLLSRSKRRSDSDHSSPGTFVEGLESGKERESFTGVILTNDFQGADDTESPLLKVGTLPILLRTILAIRKAGATRVVVCADSLTRRKIQRELLDMGRLPHFADWIEAGSDTPLPHLFKKLASESGCGNLILTAGSCTYHPSLFRQAREWDGKGGALALVTNDQPVGICALPADSVLDVIEHCPSEVLKFTELHAWLISGHFVQCEPVEEGLWQRVLTPEDRIAAERKLDRWLVKPTDGIFARMNRRVSVPISRQIVKLPITPNMVSLFTLGVGLAAGVFFACGGYWNMLVGAILSVWASILDGCDGEVARLKLMESDFGCWLETVCDWLYYFFVFAGMAIGLSRGSESKTYLVWGGVLLSGAMMSFLITGLGRHRLAAGRPEQYLGIWQAKAESRRSNPILSISRRIEFIIRRCFLPYALIFFAVLNLTKVAFFLAAIGANVVWLVSLYSYCAFALTRRPPLRDSTASA